VAGMEESPRAVVGSMAGAGVAAFDFDTYGVIS
jgi:hypothetical protein